MIEIINRILDKNCMIEHAEQGTFISTTGRVSSGFECKIKF